MKHQSITHSITHNIKQLLDLPICTPPKTKRNYSINAKMKTTERAREKDEDKSRPKTNYCVASKVSESVMMLTSGVSMPVALASVVALVAGTGRFNASCTASNATASGLMASDPRALLPPLRADDTA
eukprot:m.122450 g.122450  ORF g.122450 m.122450 type:complete len:127 (-) comp13732_c0_seq2:3650-4030(-)